MNTTLHLKITLLFAFFIGVLPLLAQTVGDQSKILKLCVDFPELQEYYPNDNSGGVAPLYVMNYTVSFDDSILVSKNDKPVAFMFADEIENNGVEAFFQFMKLEVLGDKAEVKGRYIYNYAGNIDHFTEIELQLLKAGEKWSITSSSIKNF